MKKVTVILNSEKEERVLLALLDNLDYEYEITTSSSIISTLPNVQEAEQPILMHYATE